MKKDKAIEKFEKIMIIRNLSSNSIRMYKWYVLKFFEFAKVDDTKKLTLDTAQDYILYLKERGDAPSSINAYLSAIRYFYETVAEVKFTRRQFPNLIYNHNDCHVFTIDEIKLMLSNADEKLKVMILLGFDCGLRISEVANLRIKDISRKHMTIFINNSKRNKSRTVKMSDMCFDAICNYWRIYRTETYLFEGRKKGVPVNNKCLSNLFTSFMKKIGLYAKGVHFHSLRHTYATNMLNEGCDVFLLKKLLGHSTLVSTSRYVHLVTRDVENSFSLSDRLLVSNHG